MKLLPKELEAKLPPIYSTEGIPFANKVAVIRYYSLYSDWEWYVVEGHRYKDDYGDEDVEFFGLVCGFEREWGYFTLRELEKAHINGMPVIERDLHFKPKTFGEMGLA